MSESIRNLRKREQHALLRLPRDLGLPDVVQDDPPALAAEAVALDALLEQLHLEQQLRRLLVADAVFQEYRAGECILRVENKSRESIRKLSNNPNLPRQVPDLHRRVVKVKKPLKVQQPDPHPLPPVHQHRAARLHKLRHRVEVQARIWPTTCWKKAVQRILQSEIPE